MFGLTFWQRYSILKAKDLTLLPKNYKDYSGFLGVLGISGLKAYFGFKKIENLKKGAARSPCPAGSALHLPHHQYVWDLSLTNRGELGAR